MHAHTHTHVFRYLMNLTLAAFLFVFSPSRLEQLVNVTQQHDLCFFFAEPKKTQNQTSLTFCILLVLLLFSFVCFFSYSLMFLHLESLFWASFVSYSLNFSSLGLSGDSRKITLSWYVQLVSCQLTTITPPPPLPVHFLASPLHPPSVSLQPLLPHPTHEPHPSPLCRRAAPSPTFSSSS